MRRSVLVGLSSPTFYDYQHSAHKAKNDNHSSPNPILENAIGLAVFYDEIWFLCESLCPQSLRGCSRVRYIDKDLPKINQGALSQLLAATPIITNEETVNAASASNFGGFWKSVSDAGADWGAAEMRKIDNHTHEIDLFGHSFYAASNRANVIVNDLACAESLGMDLALNSFNMNIYNALYPNQFDPLIQDSINSLTSSALIQCSVSNAVTVEGPHPSLFELAATSSTRKDFRRYIEDRSPQDAYESYQQLADEIRSHTSSLLRKEARQTRAFEGLVRVGWDLLCDSVTDLPTGGVGKWYLAQMRVPPSAAAAFLYDLQSFRKS